MRALLILLVGLFPSSRLKNWLLCRAGYDIARTACLRPSLLWRLPGLHLSGTSTIGFGNVLRGCSVSLGEEAFLGQFNWVTASAAFADAPRSLILREHSSVTSRHYIDCPGGVEIEAFATVAGVRSVFISHGIDVGSNRQTANGIRIGGYCLLSSCVKVTPGAVIGPRSLVAMGAVVHGELPGGHLYAGVPARAVRPVDGAYFDRTTGYVD